MTKKSLTENLNSEDIALSVQLYLVTDIKTFVVPYNSAMRT